MQIPIVMDFTVELTKNRGDSLGIGFRKLAEPPHCEVSILVSNGVAAKSGLVHEGDMLLSVNGINVKNLSPSEVGGVLARHSTDPVIKLELRREVTNGSNSDIGNSDTGNSDIDIDIPEDPEDDEPPPISNGHPTIVVEGGTPSISPDCLSPNCLSPVSDGPPEAPATGWRGGGLRLRRNNALLPKIQETDGITSSKPPTTLNLNVQQVASKRHSLTPEATRKPREEINKFSIRSSKSLDLANLPQWRSGPTHRNVVMHNLQDGTELTDRLHSHAIKVKKFAKGISLLYCRAGVPVWLIIKLAATQEIV